MYGLIIIRLSQKQYLHTNKSTASDKTGETTGRGQDTQRRHTLLAILTGAEAFRVGWGRWAATLDINTTTILKVGIQ